MYPIAGKFPRILSINRGIIPKVYEANHAHKKGSHRSQLDVSLTLDMTDRGKKALWGIAQRIFESLSASKMMIKKSPDDWHPGFREVITSSSCYFRPMASR